tara:strand:- start:148 stop:543 length:396 start_codon:yes stop_codon:yes gene_type:complete
MENDNLKDGLDLEQLRYDNENPIESLMQNVNIKEKDIVILRFDEAYPVPEESMYRMMHNIRRVINYDKTLATRFICLADGLNIETMGESEFVTIWKNKFGDESFENANRKEDTDIDTNQLNLFEEGDTTDE